MSTTLSSHQCPHMPINSCIYAGTTTHTRLHPIRNSFTYKLYMAYVDLFELESGKLSTPLFSSNFFSPLSILPSDHMHPPSTTPLSTRVRDLVESETGKRPTGPIFLLTNLRIFGIEFNPVSFYYVWNDAQTTLEHVVAEVSNFPWFEQHSYVLTPSVLHSGLRAFSGHEKAFHVSPFLPIDGLNYSWLIAEPDENVLVKIGVNKEGKRVLSAGMQGTRVKWSTWNLLYMQVRYPVHALMVMMGILYEAARLFRLGVQFHPHPTGASSRLSRIVEGVVDGLARVAQVKQRWGEWLGRNWLAQRVAR